MLNSPCQHKFWEGGSGWNLDQIQRATLFVFFPPQQMLETAKKEEEAFNPESSQAETDGETAVVSATGQTVQLQS